jgi:cellulose biosynthesis protein BcsQ
MKQTLVVAMSNQKGGVGKSAATVLLASYLHYTKEKNVAIVDCSGIQEIEKREKTKSEHDKDCLNFKIFKIRKVSIIISLFSLLIFVITTFCIKLQNDYSLLNDEYYWKSIAIREIQAEVDSLRRVLINQNIKKK